ncbi:class I SAM-dependent methyltransferase [Kribbella sp. NPDC023855]|uniref:class I SAM-dependent methyltransferase n=1 Tax=Kribbella sp. NPDC023855 TaxID=3154698 RepID=UPI003405B111
MRGVDLYDDPAFLTGYRELRREKRGLNDELEIPAMAGLLPAVDGLRVIDLGCGEGGLAVRLAEAEAGGAAEVLGVDASAAMLARAVAHPRVRYQRADLADFELPAASVDLVVSSLALHYVEDFEELVGRVAAWLVPSGWFVFSVEHPVVTAPLVEGTLDDYADEGPRQRTWFGRPVVKYHRTLATTLATLQRHGFSLQAVQEPLPTEAQVAAHPHLAIHRRRPPLLLVSARLAAN